jgi:hypothetical protein
MRPPTNLLFITQVIYEYGERWWNDIDRRNPESPTKSLAILRTVICYEAVGTGEENAEFGFAKCFCSYFPSDFLHAVKS